MNLKNLSFLLIHLMAAVCVTSIAPAQSPVVAQQAVVTPGHMPAGPSIIDGDPYTVSTLRFKLSKNQKDPLPSAEISVLYVWRWLEYPYPEHSCGAFSSANERVE